jgi:hypothetical protein
MNSMFLRRQDWQEGTVVSSKRNECLLPLWVKVQFKVVQVLEQVLEHSGRSLLIISKNAIVGYTWFSSRPKYLVWVTENVITPPTAEWGYHGGFSFSSFCKGNWVVGILKYFWERIVNVNISRLWNSFFYLIWWASNPSDQTLTRITRLSIEISFVIETLCWRSRRTLVA